MFIARSLKYIDSNIVILYPFKTMKRLLFVISLLCFNCTISAPNKYVLQCETNILRVMPQFNTPFQNFMNAYLEFSQYSFKRDQALAKDYFIELLNNTELEDWNSLHSPLQFCQIEYDNALQDDCLKAVSLTGCPINMPGKEAFKYLYLNKTQNDLSLGNLFPRQWPVHNRTDRVIEMEAKIALKGFLQLQTVMAHGYFVYILNQVKNKCNQSRFKSALQFCNDITLTL